MRKQIQEGETALEHVHLQSTVITIALAFLVVNDVVHLLYLLDNTRLTT
ncbi:hypothetical protein PUR58_00790 [Streptomyces sp. JV186]|nr:hypothetical protein [Streptomyces sp. JV186]MEE1721554.1 hypothetical protein [Streptomyces sp. JV186]